MITERVLTIHLDGSQEIEEYDATERFSAELAFFKEKLIATSKTELNTYLSNHPYTWIDGKKYTVTLEKQNLLAGEILDAQLGSAPPKWNSVGKDSCVWEYDDLVALRVAMKAYTAPFVEHQRKIEMSINDAKTFEEASSIEIKYDDIR